MVPYIYLARLRLCKAYKDYGSLVDDRLNDECGECSDEYGGESYAEVARVSEYVTKRVLQEENELLAATLP